MNINAPFRALIQIGKAFKDPTQAIAPVMPFPVNSPALKVEVLSTIKLERRIQARGAAAPPQSISTIWRNPSETNPDSRPGSRWRRAAQPLPGCITVKTPDKPIEVNLNVDIKQEVLVRLQQDVQQLIQKNPQAFPPRADPAMRKRPPSRHRGARGAARRTAGGDAREGNSGGGGRRAIRWLYGIAGGVVARGPAPGAPRSISCRRNLYI